MLLLFLLLFGYLLGSVSSAIIACKLMGLPDPRSQGSGNPGATNILRMAGKKLAIVVLIGDVLKGIIPVALAIVLGLSPDLLGWVVLATFLGHLYPVFFKFQGGKGVATAIGGIFILSWPLGLALILTWLLIVLIFRYSSLGAIVAAVLAPVYGYWLLMPGNYLPIVIMCIFLIYRHWKNIKNLLAGKEDKIGAKKSNVSL